VNERSFRESLAPVAVAALLILTAWGNAMAMFAVSAVGLLVTLLVSPRAYRRDGVLIAMVGAAVGVVTLLVMLMLIR
jgi:hypothetical protein